MDPQLTEVNQFLGRFTAAMTRRDFTNCDSLLVQLKVFSLSVSLICLCFLWSIYTVNIRVFSHYCRTIDVVVCSIWFYCVPAISFLLIRSDPISGCCMIFSGRLDLGFWGNDFLLLEIGVLIGVCGSSKLKFGYGNVFLNVQGIEQWFIHLFIWRLRLNFLIVLVFSSFQFRKNNIYCLCSLSYIIYCIMFGNYVFCRLILMFLTDCLWFVNIISYLFDKMYN